MTTRLNILVLALAGASLAACTSYAGGPSTWRPGHPKFTVGLSAPSVTGVDAVARERSEPRR